MDDDIPSAAVETPATSSKARALSETGIAECLSAAPTTAVCRWRRVIHETDRLYGDSLAIRREVGVHDAQDYAEKVPPLEIGRRLEPEGPRGPAAGRLRLSAA
ncbi:MAG: hypothetical protein JHC20_06630 [Pyrobaculum sp.]|nr:hypothetical protein [Pyrobaculum sp.]